MESSLNVVLRDAVVDLEELITAKDSANGGTFPTLIFTHHRNILKMESDMTERFNCSTFIVFLRARLERTSTTKWERLASFLRPTKTRHHIGIWTRSFVNGDERNMRYEENAVCHWKHHHIRDAFRSITVVETFVAEITRMMTLKTMAISAQTPSAIQRDFEQSMMFFSTTNTIRIIRITPTLKFIWKTAIGIQQMTPSTGTALFPTIAKR
mmetsp:Transcript_20793/g.51561  ORF Transcript_20793/g.51561 Transcript_20793/m.51561 type:complete len:211 (-) Transcript_20793:769-1401(-)